MSAQNLRGPTGHIAGLTGLRGVAALFVVVYHLSGGFLPDLGLSDHTSFFLKGYLAVDLFFLLSGFVMMHVYRDAFSDRLDRSELSAFVFARFARIYPLHLTILLGFVLLELGKVAVLAAAPSTPDVEAFAGGRSFLAFLSHLTMTHAVGLFEGPTWNGPAWSIGAEWFAYLGFPATVFLIARRGAAFRVALLAAIVAGLLVLSDSGTNLDIAYGGGGLWRCLFEFTLGVMLHEVYAGGRLRQLGTDAAALAIVLLLVAALHAGVADILVLPLFAGLILSLAHGEGRARDIASARAVLFLGAVSYSVYMVHMLMIEIANLVSRVATGAPLGAHLGQAGSLAVLVIGVGLVVLAAWGLHVRIELPARAAMRGWRGSAGRMAART